MDLGLPVHARCHSVPASELRISSRGTTAVAAWTFRKVANSDARWLAGVSRALALDLMFLEPGRVSGSASVSHWMYDRFFGHANLLSELYCGCYPSS